MSNKGLIDERPILFLPSLAVKFSKEKGFSPADAAIVLQQLHWQIGNAQEERRQYVHIDGKWWVYNSYGQWAERFRWLSISSLKRIFISLEKLGIIISMQGVKNSHDRRKWYTINYDRFAEYMSNADDASDQIDPIHQTKLIPSSSDQIDPMYTKSTTENTTKNVASNEASEVKAQSIPDNGQNNVQASKKKNTIPASQMNPMKDAIVTAFGWKKENVANWGTIQKTARELCIAGYLPDDIPGIYTHVKAKSFPSFTPAALSKYAAEWKATQRRTAARLEAMTAPAPVDNTPPMTRADVEAIRQTMQQHFGGVK